MVEVLAMSIAVANEASFDFCHFTTVPILPVKTISEAIAPAHMFWLALKVPPTEEIMLTVCVTPPVVLLQVVSTLLTQ